jgi:L-fuconate dehydratase
VHKDPDYSAAYVILKTDHPAGLEGHGLTFTIGRGNDICCAAIQSLATLIKGINRGTFCCFPLERLMDLKEKLWR